MRAVYITWLGGADIKGPPWRICATPRKWIWADGRIEGDTIVVSSPSVANPQEVRYAWQSNPAATLFNGAGLPAAPFRTDHWPGHHREPAALLTAGMTNHEVARWRFRPGFSSSTILVRAREPSCYTRVGGQVQNNLREIEVLSIRHTGRETCGTKGV
jgi:hypothetical protein